MPTPDEETNPVAAKVAPALLLDVSDTPNVTDAIHITLQDENRAALGEALKATFNSDSPEAQNTRDENNQ